MSSLLRVKKLIIPVESIEEILSRSDQWIVIGERGGAIVATLHLEKAAHVCRLGMFAVAPELQARGIGKRLLGEAERRARAELGCTVMQLLVITIRRELIAWYRRRGYRSIGAGGRFPYGDERCSIPLRDDLSFELLEKKL